MPLIPAGVWALALLGTLTHRRRVREAALLALTYTAAVLVAITEILSAIHAISPAGLGIAWTFALVATLLWARPHLSAGVQRIRTAGVGALRPGNRMATALLATFALGTLAAALLYPPVNYDSLTAHMPRVFFWLQNGSVAHYPTPFGPQLFSGTTTAYTVLHLMGLAGGGDRLANLAGWLAYVFAVMTASLIAMRLGAGRRGQLVAALAAATTPMALLQASTTQTDMTTALWCLATAYGVLCFVDAPPRTLREGVGWALPTGVALGLAGGAKASAYLVLAPLALWLAVTAFRRLGVARAVALGSTVIAVTVAVNLGGYVRNARVLDGDPIGSQAPGMAHILVTDRSPGALAATALKNASMLLGSPSEAANGAVSSAVRALVRVIGQDADGPSNAEEVSGPYRLDGRVTNHDVGPAPFMVALIVLAVAVGGLTRRLDRRTTAYLACATMALVLVAALVSWNLFINRILLPPLALMVPAIGVVYERAHPLRAARAALAIALALALAWGAFVLAFNSTNRLVPPTVLPSALEMRDLGWWNTRYDDLRFRVLAPEMEEPSRAVAEAITERGLTRVGIHDRVLHAPIYPLLHLLRDREVGYVGDTVLRDRIDSSGLRPEAIVEIVSAEDYPAVLADGTPRGGLLLEPQRAGEYYVILLYQPHDGDRP